jgi:hypothetical protein
MRRRASSVIFAIRGYSCRRRGILGVMERGTRRDLPDHLLEIRALRKVLGRAVRSVLDHLLGSLSLGNPPLE